MLAENGRQFDDEQGFLPCSDLTREQHQERPIGAGQAGPLDGAVQDDQLLPQQRVFDDQFRLAPCHVHDRAADECGTGGLR